MNARIVPLRAHAVGGFIQGVVLYCLYAGLMYALPSLGPASFPFSGVIGVAVLVLLLWPLAAGLWAGGPRLPRRPRLTAIGVWVAAFALGIVVTTLGWDVVGRRALANAATALDQAEYRYDPPKPAPPVPDGDNAAEWLKRASAASRPAPTGVPVFPVASDALPPKDVERAREMAGTHAKAIDLVLRAAQASQVDWKMDWSRNAFVLDVPADAAGSRIQLLELGRLVAWTAVLAAMEGKVAEAEGRVAAVLAAARALGQIPLSIPQAMASRLTRDALDAARHVLAQPAATGEGFRRALPEGTLAAGIRRAQTLELRAFPELLADANILSFAHTPAAGVMRAMGARAIGEMLTGGAYYPLHRLDVAHHQRIALAILRAIHAPPAEMQARFRDAQEAIERRHWLLTGIAYTSTTQVTTLLFLALDGEADASLARAAIEARAERKRAGRWPDAVAQLDPYTGRPLRARVDGDALLIWSVGRDQRDDGGAVVEGGSVRGPDLVWRARP